MDYAELSRSRFISLTTFRKTGVGVSTTVWVTGQDGSLLVTTPVGSGKLKRLRNNPRVEMRPCSRMGKVAPDAPLLTGIAHIEDDSSEAEDIFKKKYTLEYWLFMKIEAIVAKAGSSERKIIRILAENP